MTALKTSCPFQLAQNEAGGAGDHRPSVSKRKGSGVVPRKYRKQNLWFSFGCLVTCVLLLIIFFGEYNYNILPCSI